MFPLVGFVITTILLQTVESDPHPLVSWTVSDTILPVASGNMFAAWDEDSSFSDCVFVFGGLGCTDCFYCFNITTDDIYEWDTLPTDSNRRSSTQQSFMFINNTDGLEYIYFGIPEGIIKRYDIKNKVETTVDSSSLRSACMSLSPNNNQFYVLGGQSDDGNKFSIYSLDGNDAHTKHDGDDLTHSRQGTACVISTYGRNSYLYAITGRSQYIERILIDDKVIENQWETMMVQFTNDIDDRISGDLTNLDHVGIVSYKQYIYIIAGRDYAVISTNNVIYLNVETMTFEYIGEFPILIDTHACIIASNRIYTFGGRYDDESNNIGWYDVIYFSNLLNDHYPTLQPSIFPSHYLSEAPSGIPSVVPSTIPSSVPSNKPSNEPSTIPSSIPSNMPSNIPSSMPSNIPSNVPSNKPSTKPSTIPSSIPSNIPSNTPSTAPSVNPSAGSQYTSTNLNTEAHSQSVKHGNENFLSDSDTTNLLINVLIIVSICMCFGCFILAAIMVKILAKKDDNVHNARVNSKLDEKIGKGAELVLAENIHEGDKTVNLN